VTFLLIHALMLTATVGLPLYCAFRLIRQRALLIPFVLICMAVASVLMFYIASPQQFPKGYLGIGCLALCGVTAVMTVFRPWLSLHLLAAVYASLGALLIVEAENIRFFGLTDDAIATLAAIVAGLAVLGPYGLRVRRKARATDPSKQQRA
jgi:hypothetical protein